MRQLKPRLNGGLMQDAQVQKTQFIRLLDVYVLGPFMIYAGFKKGPLRPLERKFLKVMGVATVMYNLHNYKRQLERLQPQKNPLE